MQGFVQGADRQQTTLLPECRDDWIGESNPIRAVDVFVDALEFRDLGFDGIDPAAAGVTFFADAQAALRFRYYNTVTHEMTELSRVVPA